MCVCVCVEEVLSDVGLRGGDSGAAAEDCAPGRRSVRKGTKYTRNQSKHHEISAEETHTQSTSQQLHYHRRLATFSHIYNDYDEILHCVVYIVA